YSAFSARPWPLPTQAGPEGILAPGDVGDVQCQGRLPKNSSHQSKPLAEGFLDCHFVRLCGIRKKSMATDFDPRPAKAEFQEGDALGDGGITSSLSAGLLQFLAKLDQRLWMEDSGGSCFLGGSFVHQRLQPIKIPANRFSRGPKTSLAVIVN